MDHMDKNSIFSNNPINLPQEITEVILQSNNLRIERIISQGQASPKDFWYDQEENEWVLILQGSGRLQFADEFMDLQEGDYINIPAHKKHRVDWTDSNRKTIWLAIFYK